jgi:hypothetical protein
VPFNIMMIRELDDNGDGLLYPIPSGESNGIEPEAADGGNVRYADVIRIVVNRGDGPTTVMETDRLKARLRITDCRVTVACTKFDKGGGYWGMGIGAVVAVGANAVSAARAASRRHGRCLVGQVRYPWIGAVGFSPKRGFTTDERLILSVKDQEQSVRLILTLPKSTPAKDVALEILKRASAYNLDRVVYADDAAEVVRSYARPPFKAAAANGVTVYGFPKIVSPNASTAYGDR